MLSQKSNLQKILKISFILHPKNANYQKNQGLIQVN